jgi:hypothetical protein
MDTKEDLITLLHMGHVANVGGQAKTGDSDITVTAKSVMLNGERKKHKNDRD